jgi:hypothetical protein
MTRDQVMTLQRNVAFERTVGALDLKNPALKTELIDAMAARIAALTPAANADPRGDDGWPGPATGGK